MPPDNLNLQTKPGTNSKNRKVPRASPASQGKAGTLIEKKQKLPFYIAGIGGSAGSLEAFEEFFRNMPVDTGMAFVLVSHLDPTHKALLAELLQRVTTMKVIEVIDGMKVLPNSVYVIPPNKDMSIMHGTLQLLEPSMPRGFRMPIDFFFRHLADDQKELGIGIILSGMGTDGTLGLKAIKEKMGLVMVQDISSAKYDGMPQSAINTGIADIVAPVHELPARLQSYINHSPSLPWVLPVLEKKTAGAVNKIFALLRAQTGNDFSLYKKSIGSSAGLAGGAARRHGGAGHDCTSATVYSSIHAISSAFSSSTPRRASSTSHAEPSAADCRWCPRNSLTRSIPALTMPMSGSRPYASSSKRNRRAFSATPVGSPCARHFSSRQNGTQRHATAPRSQARGPGAAVSQSIKATGTPDRNTVFCGKSSL